MFAEGTGRSGTFTARTRGSALISPDRNAGSPVQWLLNVLMLAAAYALTARIGLTIPYVGAFVTLIWLPSGLSVAALVRGGVRLWPGVSVGALVVNLWGGASWPVALAISVGNTLAPLVAVAILRHCGVDTSFSRRADVGHLLLAAAVGMTVSAVGGVGALHAGGLVPNGRLGSAAITWWLGDTLGVLLVAPLVLSASRSAWRELADVRRSFWVTLGVGVVLSFALFVHPWEGSTWITLLMLPIALVAWAATRLNPTGTALITLLLALGAAGGVIHGVGPFASADPFEELRVLATYIALMAGLGLLLTAMLSERRAGEHALARSESRYRELFDANPESMWVYDPVDGAILLVNEAALAQYGYTRAEFLTMRIQDLDVRTRDGAPLPLGSGGVPARHATRHGRTLDVELTVRPFEFDGRTVAMLLARDVTEIRRLERRIELAAADERQRLMRDLHDGLGQELTGLAMYIRALENRARSGRDLDLTELERVHVIASGALQTCRRVSRGLSPLHDTQGGLPRALADLASQLSTPHGPEVALDVDERVAPVPLQVAEHLLGIAREAVTNAVRHSNGGLVTLSLRAEDGRLVLDVADDGRGIRDGDAAGVGMHTMAHRARLIGAAFSVDRVPDGGTRVRCELGATGIAAGTERPARVATARA
jgi:PAS domain S-box-containing protein